MSQPTFRAVGRNVRIYPGAKIIGAEWISIGDDVIIDDFVFIQAAAPSHIGNRVHIASFASISGGGVFCLEDFSGLSSGVRILTGSEDFMGGGLTNPTIPPELRAVARSRTVLRAHAIVGANSVVLPGVTIGAGAAVGALSLVRKSLEPWTVYAGNPLRAIGSRPSQRILELEQALYQRYGRPQREYRDLETGQ